MCGIAGVYGLCDEVSIARMINAMSHRGPDDEGIWSDPAIPATLGHRRLSILDLSQAGHQPMGDQQNRYWIVFNGEIYNFRELAEELRHHGCTFHTSCDTEVILAAFDIWGVDAINRFRGMFAFAIIDRQPGPGQPAMLLVRDRLGIKPLLYYKTKNQVWFSSEIAGLRAAAAAGCSLNADSFYDYCIFGSVLQPRTMLQGVYSLPPGHVLQVFPGGEIKLTRYWDLHESTTEQRNQLSSISETDAIEQLEHLLEQATRRHMVADVPVGAFLSGGLDSAVVVALMQKIRPGKVKTFSLGFASQKNVTDERVMARESARLLDTEHTEIVLEHKDMANDFGRIVASLDQPSIDGANTWLIARAAAQEVKVVVSGLGGDELFAGYPHFRLLSEADKKSLDGCPPAFRFWHFVRRHARVGPFSFRKMVEAAPRHVRRALVRRILQNYDIAHAFHRDLQPILFQRVEEAYEEWSRPDADSIQQTSYAEVRGYLLNTLLRDSDIVSMAHSIELRPVLLDHEVAEFAYALPAHLKLNDTIKKYILKKAAADLLPHEILYRPKRGFELPQKTWMTTVLKSQILDLLNDSMARKLFSPVYIKQTSRLLREGQARSELWAWSILMQWLLNTGIPLG